MIKYIFTVEGMMCCNCEKHAVDSVKSVLPSAKVKASFKEQTVEVITKRDYDENIVISAINDRGYTVKGYSKEEIENRGLFSFLKK